MAFSSFLSSPSLFLSLLSLPLFFLTTVQARPASDHKSVLFYEPLTASELTIATGLGLTAVVLNSAEWAALLPSDVSSYRAVIFGDPDKQDPSWLTVPSSNRDIWSAAITGNIIIMGTDTGHHYSDGIAGAGTLMKNGISFAVSDVSPTDPTSFKTGLYLSLSEYYSMAPETSLEITDNIAQIRVMGVASGCYDDIAIVAQHEALAGLSDTALTNWGCSVHEVITDYPRDEFVALAVAEGISGPGEGTFSPASNDTSSVGIKGTPYIIARGAKAVNCGNGRIDPGEDCDSGKPEGDANCPATCKKDPDTGGGKCEYCDPSPEKNKCHVSTACSNTPFGTQCVCRPGFRADAAGTDTSKHWRLNWPVPGHEHRVYVSPGTECINLCDLWWEGATGCQEVAVANC